MDTKTKIHTVISLVLVAAITGLALWAQTPSKDLKANILSTDTVLVRIQDFAFDPDIVRIDADTTVSWLHDEPEANSDVQHTVTSYDPEDATAAGEEFDSDLMSLGDTFSRTFSSEGVYYYNCSLHPFMTGKICVGEASELLDEDCAVPLTDLSEEGLTDEENLDAAADESLADEDVLTGNDDDDAPATDTVTNDAVDINTLTDEEAAALLLEDEPETDTSLFDAADEEFDSDTLNFNGEEFVFVQPEAATNVTGGEGSELADSGPEHMIYLLLLAVAFYGAKKLTPKKA